MANSTLHVCPSPMAATSNGAFQGDNPLNFALPLAILQICLVLLLTRSIAFILKPLRQPRVIAEMIVSSFLFTFPFVAWSFVYLELLANFILTFYNFCLPHTSNDLLYKNFI